MLKHLKTFLKTRPYMFRPIFTTIFRVFMSSDLCRY